MLFVRAGFNVMFPLHFRHFAEVMFFACADEDETGSEAKGCAEAAENSHGRAHYAVSRATRKVKAWLFLLMLLLLLIIRSLR